MGPRSLPIVAALCLALWRTTQLAHAAEPSHLDSLRAALRSDIAEQKTQKTREARNQVAADEEALGTIDSIDPEDARELERVVKDIAGGAGSDKVRRECEAILHASRAKENERVKQFAKEVEEKIQRASEIALKAQTAREMDGPIAELRSVIDHTPYGDETSERYSVIRRLERARDTAQHWQDYLSCRESGDLAQATDELTHLADEKEGGLNIPRSELLARVRQIEPEEEQQINQQGRAILDSIHSLDEMADALKRLQSLPYARSRQLAGVVHNLDHLARTYAGLKQGVAVTLNLAHNPPGDADPVIVRLQGELLLAELPTYLQVPATRGPRPGETIETYLRRLADEAHAARDWDLIDRVLYARREMTLHVAGTWSSDNLKDYSAFAEFQQARVQDRAQQFAAAVRLYEKALRDGGDKIPADVIGERLAAIRKEHPAEFEEGTRSKRSADAAEK